MNTTETLPLGLGTEEQDNQMLGCPSYDYQTQEWRDYSDHAHHLPGSDDLKFCGADWVTCDKAN